MKVFLVLFLQKNNKSLLFPKKSLLRLEAVLLEMAECQKFRRSGNIPAMASVLRMAEDQKSFGALLPGANIFHGVSPYSSVTRPSCPGFVQPLGRQATNAVPETWNRPCMPNP